MKNIYYGDDANFSHFLNNCENLLVDFYSLSCIPCKQLEPNLEKAANDFKTLNILKINVDSNPLTCSKYRVKGLPTLLFIKEGKVIHQLVGASGYPQLKKEIQNIF